MTPQEIVALLSAEYGGLPQRPHGDPMAELVLTILSQHTSDINSGRAFARLLERLPTWESILTSDAKAIEDAIRPGGLAASKAPRLKALLAEIWQRGGSFDLSFLRELPLEEAKGWLRSLPGVGPKTAACVLLFALGRPALPVDTHVFRVAGRLGLIPAKATPHQAHDILEAMLKPEEVYPFHINLIKHGRRVCHAQRPACPACVLRQGCPSAVLFLPASAPVSAKGEGR